MTRALTAASRLRLFSLRELAAHRRRTVASNTVMAMSAMYLVAVLGIFGSITESVNRLADGIAGLAALEVSGIIDAGFADTVTADAAAVPGVATAAPMIRRPRPRRRGRFCCSTRTITAPGWVASWTPSSPDSWMHCSRRHTGCGSGRASLLPKGERFRLGSGSVAVLDVLADRQLAELNGGHFVLAPLALAQNVSRRPGRLDSILIT
ncbi:hypothetical protein H7H78_16280 [Mycobacterium shinjukuense]|nr:hypothetical protein [Mycobacterium shinjukuense]